MTDEQIKLVEGRRSIQIKEREENKVLSSRVIEKKESSNSHKTR